MTTQVLHPLAAAYLERLREAARRLPSDRRDELLADIEAHLAEAIAPDASEADARNVLDRLGTPEEIVAAEAPAPAASTDGRGTREWAAVILLLFGGFVFGVGWLVGLILLWSSPQWSTREKWLGTLVVPGGWAGAFFALIASTGVIAQTCVSGGPGTLSSCTPGPSPLERTLAIGVMAILILGPLFTAIYLARRARTAPALRS